VKLLKREIIVKSHFATSQEGFPHGKFKGFSYRESFEGFSDSGEPSLWLADQALSKRAAGPMRSLTNFLHHQNGEEFGTVFPEAQNFWQLLVNQEEFGPIGFQTNFLHHCHGEESKFKGV